MSVDPKSAYYDAGGIETLAIIRAKLSHEEYRGYLRGNAIKYLCRAGLKDDMERDIEKAVIYLKELLNEIGNPQVEAATPLVGMGAADS